MPPTLADHVYGHCVAVLGASDSAAEAAASAMRRGGRGKSSALGWARHEALLRAAPDADLAAQPADLNELAAMLAFTRPPAERAVVDLDGRQGLDRAQLGRALGTTPARAATAAAEVGADWDAALDPVLLAHLGPGDCADFPENEGATLGDLIAAGPTVAVHADSCEMCGDRRRAMVSVRSLLAHRPLEEAPIEVATASPSRSARFRSFNPPPLQPDRRRTAIRAAVVALAAIVVIGLGTIGAEDALNRSHAPGRNDRVRALTKVAVANALHVSPSVLGTLGTDVELANTSGHSVTWRIVSPVDWVTVSPADGRLSPGQRARLKPTVGATAPGGPQAVTLTIAGDDGSAAALRIETLIERPPQVGATLDGCRVTATAEDDNGIASVSLHWRDGSGEQSIDLLKGPTGYVANLPQRATSLTWWVAASDTHGVQALTSAQTVTNCQ